MLEKKCQYCGNVFKKPVNCSLSDWNNHRKYCSKSCSNKAKKGKLLSEVQKKKISASLVKAYKEGRRISTLPSTPWNKGLTKDTDEKVAEQANKLKGRSIPIDSRKKISEKLKQFFEVEAHRQEVSKGMKNLWGKPEFREKLSGKNAANWMGGDIGIICGYCGKVYSVKRGEYNRNNNHFCTRDCWLAWNRGENHYNYQGEITSLYYQIRNSLKYKEWRTSIFERDDYTCRFSGEKSGDLEVHHIKPFSTILEENNITSLEEALECEELWDIDNGITLLEKWHRGILTDNELAFHRQQKWGTSIPADFKRWFLAITDDKVVSA